MAYLRSGAEKENEDGTQDQLDVTNCEIVMHALDRGMQGLQELYQNERVVSIVVRANADYDLDWAQLVSEKVEKLLKVLTDFNRNGQLNVSSVKSQLAQNRRDRKGRERRRPNARLQRMNDSDNERPPGLISEDADDRDPRQNAFRRTVPVRPADEHGAGRRRGQAQRTRDAGAAEASNAPRQNRLREDAFSTVIGLQVKKEDGSQGSISNGFKNSENGEVAFFITCDEESTTQQTLDEIAPLLKAVNDAVMIDAKLSLSEDQLFIQFILLNPSDAGERMGVQ